MSRSVRFVQVEAVLLAQLRADPSELTSYFPSSDGPPLRIDKHPSLSLNSAWHGVHYLLCGELESGPAPLSRVVLGGKPFHGRSWEHARYLTSEEVCSVAEQLADPSLIPVMNDRFNPDAMAQMGVYPNNWTSGDFAWLLQHFHHLRDFYTAAAVRRLAMLTCLA